MALQERSSEMPLHQGSNAVPISTRIELMHPKVVESLRLKTPAERIALASKMHRDLREMLVRQLQHDHPEWNDAQVALAVRRRLLGGTD